MLFFLERDQANLPGFPWIFLSVPSENCSFCTPWVLWPASASFYSFHWSDIFKVLSVWKVRFVFHLLCSCFNIWSTLCSQNTSSLFCQKYLSSLETANKVSLEWKKKNNTTLSLFNLKREDTHTRTLKATRERAGSILQTFNCFLLF